jgi:Flp pilus assembly protein TadD
VQAEADFEAATHDEAEREYRAALRADGSFGEAHNNLAVVLMMTGRLDEAQRHLDSAEAAGFAVDPRFKRDLAARRLRPSATSP